MEKGNEYCSMGITKDFLMGYGRYKYIWNNKAGESKGFSAGFAN